MKKTTAVLFVLFLFGISDVQATDKIENQAHRRISCSKREKTKLCYEGRQYADDEKRVNAGDANKNQIRLPEKEDVRRMILPNMVSSPDVEVAPPPEDIGKMR